MSDPISRVLIVGAGDLGQLISRHLHAVPNLELAGFVDDVLTPGEYPFGSVHGGTTDVDSLFDAKVCTSFLIGIGYRHFQVRQQMFEQLSEVLPAAVLVHPSAYVDPSANLGAGTIVFPRAIVDVDAKLGENVLVNTAANVCHHTNIGSHTFIAPAACVAGFVNIGKRCFLGINSTVRDNLTVAHDVLLGAGSVLTREASTPGTYIGVPARQISSLEMNE